MTLIKHASDIAETSQWLDDLLNQQASQATGAGFVNEIVALEAWDGDIRLGGLTAKFGREWVFIELLALEETARGNGAGARLVTKLEEIAAERGKSGLWLDTYSFQAPGFYEKLGFQRVGHIPDYPKGHARYFYAKRLDGQSITGPDIT
jgi:ribosomal protein S18 acetylase RimI-like enzyme